MVNVILVVISVILLLAIIAACVYIIIYFSHEADKNTAWFPKALVLSGMVTSFVMILMLPMDVSNSRTDGGLPMYGFWIASFAVALALIVVLLPFAIFFYEAEDPDKESFSKKFVEGLKYTLGTIFVFAVLTGLLWYFLGVAEVPYIRLYSTLAATQLDAALSCSNDCQFVAWVGTVLNPGKRTGNLDFEVSPVLYGISILTLFGTLLFVVFCGIGFAALPLDLFNDWKNRPRFIPRSIYDEQTGVIGGEAERLIEIGNSLMDRFKKRGAYRPQNRRQRKAFNYFKAEVYYLEEDYEKLQKQYNKGLGPKIALIVVAWIKLPLAFICAALSLLWCIHIIIYDAPNTPFSPFLNQMFIELDNAWGLLGVIFYGIFAYYLLWSTIKGNFKFGLRVPLLFSIHPMKIGETMMNSFLFNVMLLLMSTLVVLQFSSLSFSLYSRFTTIDLIYNVGVTNLRYIKYFWRYYFIAIIFFALISAIYFIAFPAQKRRSKKKYLV
eukprot:TRINITY_DN536_c0_g1_i1.p1 TRINITY_DN536_c0_g1~~TRINITY_DN536_c0_g1_i1.p1  ORF type:complete len:495 (-),score=126.51 TRINITY_DN536_c0_g1_i1:219-1703(-)